MANCHTFLEIFSIGSGKAKIYFELVPIHTLKKSIVKNFTHFNI